MYIRLSREDGDKQESESIGNQRKILQRYVKENNVKAKEDAILINEKIVNIHSEITDNKEKINILVQELLQDANNLKVKGTLINNDILGCKSNVILKIF